MSLRVILLGCLCLAAVPSCDTGRNENIRADGREQRAVRDSLLERGLYDCCTDPGCVECVKDGQCACDRKIRAKDPICGECLRGYKDGKGKRKLISIPELERIRREAGLIQ